MKHALVTIIAPLAIEKVLSVRALIEERLGNPAFQNLRDALMPISGDEAIHFMSLHAFAGSDEKRGWILLEFTGDGKADAAIKHIGQVMGAELSEIFSHASDWRNGSNLSGYLSNHEVKPSFGLSGPPGLNFVGTPGMTVGRIQKEAALRRLLVEKIAALPSGETPMHKARALRAQIAADPNFAWALEPPPPVSREGTEEIVGVRRAAILLGAAVKTYLWPLVLILIVAMILTGIREDGIRNMVSAAMGIFWKGTLIILAIGALALLMIYVRLIAQEKTDWVGNRNPSPAERTEMLKRENQMVQNHMISVTVRKPGFIRQCTSRIGFFVVGTMTGLTGNPGFLSTIGTIHFARWITVPGTRDMVFLSNYDGSWESYLEDFITKAHEGLTAIWSNTVGFPRTRALVKDGATDGERFKRFARHSMIRTSFWYSAYPDISTANIRTNALVRRGLALAESDEEATRWFSLLGSAVRPPDKLETGQIQSLVFGGLGFLPHASCMLVDLVEDRQASMQWLRDIQPHIAFGDGRRLSSDAVITMALSSEALRKLGLTETALETFPSAFVDGMTGPGRDRVLGDPDAAARLETWAWGAEREPDVAIIVYGKTDAALATLQKSMTNLTKAAGHRIAKTIALSPTDVQGAEKEPFGFADGISQPMIKGSFRAARDADPLHLVEPGEFILGYPDNRGNFPPSPHVTCKLDPDQILPIGNGQWDFDASIECADRDLGRNGSFLVIRQLAQEVEAFHDYCTTSAEALKGQFGDINVTRDFIGAKMLGRWPDGSSLVRWPHEPAHGRDEKYYTSDNGFKFGVEDPEGLRCPFGAHVRRANPRDSQMPGSQKQIDISNRHRILRVGRQYQAGKERGLLFMCLNGDIERQFEFIQQTWALSGHFHGLDGEADPVLGANGHASRFTIPTRAGPVQLKAMPNFVTTRGGGYYFLPGKKLVQFLAGSRR
jgi:deferrochelatase/peroxidase EfeB